MSNKIKLNTLAEFDMSEHLRTDDDVATYLTLVLEEGDYDEFYRAIGYAAKAQGMSQIAADTGLGRESLYKSFAAGAQPKFETVTKVMRALKLRVTAEPLVTAL